MGRLLDYFNGLKYGDSIDKQIINAVTGALVADDAGPFMYYPISLNRDRQSQNWCQIGYFLRRYYSWVIPDVERKVNSHLILPGQDVLSVNFTGCAMARFTNHKRSEIYAGHIFLRREEGDCSDIWSAYCEENQPNVSIFRPRYLKIIEYDVFWKKWGLISSSNKAYEIVTWLNVDDNARVEDIIFYKIEEVKLSYSYGIPKLKDDNSLLKQLYRNIQL